MKRTRAFALKTVAVPAVVLLGVGGGLLGSVPAFAASTNTSSTAAPVDTAAPTDAATPVETAAPTSTSLPTPTAPSAATEAPTAPVASAKPSAKAAAKLPTDLTVTSPVIPSGDDTDDAVAVDSRTVAFAGRAPVGTKIALTDFDDTLLGSAVSDSAGDWSASVTFADDLPYDQYVFVDGTKRGSELSSYFVHLSLPAATSVAPVIETPVDGTTLVSAPAPFNEGTLVTFTGTATPGDAVIVTSTDLTDSDLGFGYPVRAKGDGSWSQSIVVPYGAEEFAATAEKIDDAGQAITYPSVPSAAVSIDIEKPADFLAAPRITSPSDPDSIFSSDGANEGEATYSASSVAPLLEAQSDVTARTEGSSTTTAAADVLGQVKAAAAARGITVSAESLAADAAVPVEASAVASAAAAADDAAPADEGDAVADEAEIPGPGDVLTPEQAKLFVDEFDAIVGAYGIQVKGESDPTEPGKLLVTVAGTGTPGQGIQLYAAKPSVAYAYFQGLYPDYFAQGVLLPNVPVSTVPTYDGAVTVGADGTWSTTLALPKGGYFVTAFAVDKADPAALRYSVAGDVIAINLSGAPAAVVAAAAPGTQLAFTGSDAEGPFWAALALLGAGAALIAATARRRGRSAL